MTRELLEGWWPATTTRWLTTTISGSYAISYDYGQDGAALEVYGGRRNFFHHNVTSQNDTFADFSGGAFQGLLGALLEPIITIVDPGWVNAPAGDLRLNALSPGIDAALELG